jgi:thioredoxin 1
MRALKFLSPKYTASAPSPIAASKASGEPAGASSSTAFISYGIVFSPSFQYTGINFAGINFEGVFMAHEINITSENFNAEVLESPIPVLLDFWAPWCNPCRVIAPILSQIAEEYDGRLKVGKINIDEDTELPTSHGVLTIPALLLYNGGNLVNSQIGAVPKGVIVDMFKDMV